MLTCFVYCCVVACSVDIYLFFLFFFFFQAEDGIRDLTVTGVQTCALPIFRGRPAPATFRASATECADRRLSSAKTSGPAGARSALRPARLERSSSTSSARG